MGTHAQYCVSHSNAETLGLNNHNILASERGLTDTNGTSVLGTNPLAKTSLGLRLRSRDIWSSRYSYNYIKLVILWYTCVLVF